MYLYWQLFTCFFKIGLFTFGGGYAMLPMIQREILSRKWATKKEILDYYALAQITPGIIAVNISTFIGYKLKGGLGALCTMVGVVAPSLIIITLLALGLNEVWDNKMIQDAFAGVRLMVPALILPIVVRMIRDRATNMLSVFLMFIALILALCSVSPIIILIVCGLISALFYCIRDKK